MPGGIYCITNKYSGKQYIGSTSCFERRWKEHRRKLRADKHHCRHLQNAWNLYGQDAFEFAVVEVVEDLNDLISREQFWLDNHAPEYNINPNAANALGRKTSDETKEKLRRAKTGTTHSEETKELLRSLSSGRKHTEEAKEKIRQAHLGRKQSPEHIEKLAQTRRGRTFSPETRARMAEAHKGRKMSPESIEKTRQAHLGRKRSPETCEKIRQAALARSAEKRRLKEQQ